MARRYLATVVAASLSASLLLPALPAEASTFGPNRLVTTNGDILALEILHLDHSYLAIGGNFTRVYQPDGKAVAVSNLAVVDAVSGRVMYAGQANGFVRSLTATNMRLFAGGNFTTVGGQPRNHAAAINIGNWQVLGWNPAPPYAVYALSYDASRVFMGTAFEVRGVRQDTAARVWSQPVAGGTVRAVMNAFGRLYVGGLFEQVGPLRQHGLVALELGTGALIPSFAPWLTPDPGDGSGYDGEEVLALAADGIRARIIMGTDSSGIGPGNWIRAVDWYTGSGAGMEYTHHESAGGVQAVSVPGGGSSYVMGNHRNHADQPYYACSGQRGYYASRWAAAGPSCPLAPDMGLSGLRVNTNADNGNGGVQALVYDWTTGLLYAGGAFSKPFVSLAVYSIN